MLGDIRRPGAGGIDERTGRDDFAIAARIEHELPLAALAICAHELDARADHRAAFGRVDRIEHDEARVIDPAVRIDEPLAERALGGLDSKRFRG